MAPIFLLLYASTNEKTVTLTQIDRIPAASRAFPKKHVPITLVGNIYTVLKSHIPCALLLYETWTFLRRILFTHMNIIIRSLKIIQY